MHLKDFYQTMCTSHCPWCGHDIYALDWGVIKPQAMVGAEATCHHGALGRWMCKFPGMTVKSQNSVTIHVTFIFISNKKTRATIMLPYIHFKQQTNIFTMVVPLPIQRTGPGKFALPTPWNLCGRGWTRAVWWGFIQKCLPAKKLIN